MKNGHHCSYSEEFGRKAYEVSLECSKRCHLTELVYGKRRVKENGTHIKTYNGNWGVSPLLGCLIFASFSVFLFFCNINEYPVWREECGSSISEGIIVLFREVQVPRLFT